MFCRHERGADGLPVYYLERHRLKYHFRRESAEIGIQNESNAKQS